MRGLLTSLKMGTSLTSLGRPPGQGAAVPVLVSVPTGFGVTNGINLLRSGTSLSTDFSIDSFRPSYSVTYYHDPVSGLDTNDGLTTATPKLNASSIFTAATTGGVPYRIVTKPGIHRGTRGPDGIGIPSLNMVWEPWAADPTDPANRVWFIKQSTTTAPAWVADSGIYRRSTTAGADPVHIFDIGILDGKGMPSRYPKATSLADCQATVGTWWRDSGTGNLYVHAGDNRNLVGDARIAISATGTNMNIIPTASMNFWAQNIGFGCGDSAFLCNFTTNTGLSINAYLKNCLAFGSSSNDGFAYDADLAGCVLKVYQYRCGAAYNVKDGFNYHAQGSGASTFGVEIECWTGPNGYDTGLANNSSTLHENSRVISLNCDFAGSQDRVIHDITAAKRWMLGTTVRSSQAVSGETAMTVVAGHPDGASNTNIWMDSCTILNSATAGLCAYGTSDRIWYANMNIAGLSTSGAGQIAAYAA